MTYTLLAVCRLQAFMSAYLTLISKGKCIKNVIECFSSVFGLAVFPQRRITPLSDSS